MNVWSKLGKSSLTQGLGNPFPYLRKIPSFFQKALSVNYIGESFFINLGKKRRFYDSREYARPQNCGARREKKLVDRSSGCDVYCSDQKSATKQSG